jgi:hypothetical protein
MNYICGVMVGMLTSMVVQVLIGSYYKIGICCFSAKKWLIHLLYEDIPIDIISLVGKYRDDSGKKNS